MTFFDFTISLKFSETENSSRLVLTLVFNKPAAVDHFLVSVLLLRGRPLAALSEMIDSLAPVSTRDLTNLLLKGINFPPSASGTTSLPTL